MAVPAIDDYKNKWTIAKEARKGQERDWKLNLAFLVGKQWMIYVAGKLIEWKPPEGKPRVTSNIIIGPVRTLFARITRHRPVFSVVARTADEDDVYKARAATSFLQYLWDTCDIERHAQQALLWALITGNGFTKAIWDPYAGESVVVNGEEHKLGSIVVDHCSPFELYVDPYARFLREAAWVFHARVRPVEYVELKWGEKVRPEPFEVIKLLGPGGVSQELQRNACVVKEYWERPNLKRPYGRYAVVVGDKVVYEDENPYPEIGIPFAHVKHIPVPGEFWGISDITNLRSIQVSYNKLRSDILENTSKLSNPPLLAPLGAFKTDPDFAPGKVHYYHPALSGNAIVPLKVEPYPPQLINTLMRLLQERDDVTGVSEVSRGTVPRNIRSAAAVAYMLEQDETRLYVTAREYEALIEETLRMCLVLARKFYTYPRVIRVLGDNRSYEAKLFKAQDIPEGADVVVQAGSTLPKSVVQQQEYLFNLWDRGIVRDPRLVLRLTQYGNMEEITAEIDLDVSQAQRENEKLRNGVWVDVEDFHNHVIHISEHNKFRKTAAYEDLTNDIKELFRKHVAVHQKFLEAMKEVPGSGRKAGRAAPDSGSSGGGDEE